jgi:nucleoid DNA-binding protein
MTTATRKSKVSLSRKKTAPTSGEASHSLKFIKERQTRVEILQTISDRTGLKRVEVELVFTELADMVKSHMSKKGSGEIMIPKLGLKIRKVRRKPTKKRKMVSPLTGDEVVIPSKPARDDIKLVALKSLKESVLN